MENSKSLVAKSELEELRMGRTSLMCTTYIRILMSLMTLVSTHQAGVSLVAPNVVTELIN